VFRSNTVDFRKPENRFRRDGHDRLLNAARSLVFLSKGRPDNIRPVFDRFNLRAPNRLNDRSFRQGTFPRRVYLVRELRPKCVAGPRSNYSF